MSQRNQKLSQAVLFYNTMIELFRHIRLPRISWKYYIFAVCTGVIGYTMHNSLFYAICDVLFAPIVWVKWLILKQITIAIIVESFKFLFN